MRRCVRSPEDGDERGVDGVAIVDVHVVPAALGGEVVEAEPQHCVRTDTQRAERRNVSTENTLHSYISMVHRRRKDPPCSGHRILLKIGMFPHLNVIFVL